MSKRTVQKLVKLQYAVMNARDNKERIRHIVAGCKDGRLYTMKGVDFGEFNVNAPDTEFIEASDLDLSRITGSKLNTITTRMNEFFKEYGVDDSEGESEDVEETVSEDVEKEKVASDTQEEVKEEELEVDVDKVIAKCKKAIKKGKLEKAEELLTFLPDCKEARKLAKKIKKAQ